MKKTSAPKTKDSPEPRKLTGKKLAALIARQEANNAADLREALKRSLATGGIEPYSRKPMNELTLPAVVQNATAWAWEQHHNYLDYPKKIKGFMRTLRTDTETPAPKWKAWLDAAKKIVVKLRLNPDLTADSLGIGEHVKDYNNGREVEMQSSTITIPPETYRLPKKGEVRPDNRERDNDLFQTAHTDLVSLPLGARYEASAAISNVIGKASEARTDKDKEQKARMKDAPFAESGRERIKTCRKNAPKGGKATAHYTDAKITNAFATYKQRHPSDTLWSASNALIRKGQPLDDYKEAQGPYKRIQRIASVSQGITRDEWYGAL